MTSSSKGKPTDQALHDKITEEVKNKPNKDGGGKGQMAAWKAAEIAKEYEKQGGGYENEAGSKNEPKSGAPEHKSDSKKKDEEKKEEAAAEAKDEKKTPAKGKGAAAAEKKAAEKPKAKAASASKPKKEKKEPTQGTRKSERVSKREAEAEKETSNGKKQKK